MKFTLGEKGLNKTWQAPFPKEIGCLHCGGTGRIAFVAHEGMNENLEYNEYVCSLHPNEPPHGYWPHDCIAVAVYLCKDCLEPIALFNQG